MFYGIRVRGPNDPQPEQILEEVQDRAGAWQARDRRKRELKAVRHARSAHHAAEKEGETKQISVKPSQSLLEAQKFYRQCKAFDKERLWDRLLNRTPKAPKPKRARKSCAKSRKRKSR